jgi:hypothetical protein
VYSMFCPYTQQEEEVFVAESDPLKRRLFRATLVTKKNNLKSNMVSF